MADKSAIRPPVAGLGSLKRARELVGRGELAATWRACVEAMEPRPFHPEAYLLMAEMAWTMKDEFQAQICAERLLKMTPNWDKAHQLAANLKSKRNLPRTPIPWTKFPVSPTHPRLTVALIVRNEEEFIGACLRSVKQVASQIVVVDTGSTDRTVDIARKHGAEVYSFQWNNHFAEARNAAHQYARGDWVLFLDADEELPEDQHDHLRADMSCENVLGYRVPIPRRP